VRHPQERLVTRACLVDLTLCMGCRGCQVACKQWNELRAEKTGFHVPGGYQNPPTVSSTTHTVVVFHELEQPPGSRGRVRWIFTKRQCMHCLEPSCASACPVGALSTGASGAVVYDRARCMGCRYCMMACPYGVPTYEWKSRVPRVRKCTFCDDRPEPVCARTCPTGAIAFGTRDELLARARARMRDDPPRYHPRIYGETEAGGARWLYLSPVPFTLLGFPTLGTAPFVSYAAPALGTVPPLVVAGSAALAGLAWIIRRREEGGK